MARTTSPLKIPLPDRPRTSRTLLEGASGAAFAVAGAAGGADVPPPVSLVLLIAAICAAPAAAIAAAWIQLKGAGNSKAFVIPTAVLMIAWASAAALLLGKMVWIAFPITVAVSIMFCWFCFSRSLWSLLR